MNRKNKLTIALLSTAHFTLDSYSSFLFQLLPLLATKLRLTPAQAGLVPPMLTVASSLMQPVYGIISDRYLKRSMVVFGPLIAAVFLSCLGTANSLSGLMALVILGGVGVGIFHPQGAAMVSRAASSDGMEKRQGVVMSAFSSAGTVGYSLGPLLVAMAVNRYGLENSWYTAIWGVAFWVVLFRYCPPLERRGRDEGAPRLIDALRAAWVPLTLLYFAVVLRTAVSVSVQTYWPFALKNFGMTEMEYGSVLAGFLFFGGVGGFFGGVLADRLGARRVSMVAMLLAAPLLLGAFTTRGALSNVLLMAGGTVLNLPIPVSVVMAQRLVPGGASTVSALMMGFAWGAGALMTPIAGAMSEKFGFARALTMAAVVPLFSAALLWFYPKDEQASAARARGALAVAD
ncbi:MAG TPA: MFS transporter [Blastocatellia bacterium]|jgi:FSR family fosmidomycin resistance protein-like MFS transporter|nr:MFS transporter [Blastocatellia bacterium]